MAVICLMMWELRGLLPPDLVGIEFAEEQGLKDVVVTERFSFLAGFHGCSMVDAAAMNISATDPNALTAEGRRGVRDQYVVCLNWPFRGSTVRPR